VTNFELARLFYEMASLLEVRDESRFRIRAWQRAAQTLETLSEDVAAVAARGGLRALPGIGKEIGARIEEYLTTGRIELLERLRENLPPDFLSLLEVRGLGPRTARALWEVAGIDTIERLEEACRSGQIIGVAGIQKKTCENLLKAIAQHRAGRARALLPAAREVARQVALALSAHGGVERLEIAGSLRRMRETVKDIDILVTSTAPARVIETLVSLPSVAEVTARGETKASVRHQDGLAVDLRVVAPEAFGAALQYFTGSKAHNVRLREMAVRRGLKISEYGVFDEATGARVAGETEEDVYAAVGLPWIPPELREDGGEIDARGKAGCPRSSSARSYAATFTTTRSGRTATIRSSASSRRPRPAATSTSSCPTTRARSRSHRASAWSACASSAPRSARCRRVTRSGSWPAASATSSRMAVSTFPTRCWPSWTWSSPRSTRASSRTARR